MTAPPVTVALINDTPGYTCYLCSQYFSGFPKWLDAIELGNGFLCDTCGGRSSPPKPVPKQPTAFERFLQQELIVTRQELCVAKALAIRRQAKKRKVQKRLLEKLNKIKGILASDSESSSSEDEDERGW